MPQLHDRLDLFIHFLQLLNEEEQNQLLEFLEAEEAQLETKEAHHGDVGNTEAR